jgi:hypothetical protein
VTPSVSRTEALKTLAEDKLTTGLAGRNSRSPDTLRLVEYKNVFGTRHSDGSMTPSVPKQLAWYAVYKDVPPNFLNGPISETKEKLAPGSSCNLYAVIGAVTPAMIDGYRICDRNLPD